MKKVILAGTYPAHTFEKLRAMLPEEEFELKAVDTPEAYDAMTDAEFMILRIFKAPRPVIERNPNLKMILRWGAGFDSVDIQAAGEHGVCVTNTPGANAGAVSELAVLLMLAVGRKLLCHTESLAKGEWSKNTFLNGSFCLNGKTLGVIGAGNIGGAIARGLVRGGVFNASDITCTDLMQANLDRLLSADACFNVSQDNPTAIQGADLVVIAVKPWRVEAVIDEIRGALDYERQSVVSVAAGIPFERLLRYFTKDAVTRYLPCS